MNKSKRSKPTPKPSVEPVEQKELKNVSLHVNEFGEIVRDVKTDDINVFLDVKVPDKKLTD